MPTNKLAVGDKVRLKSGGPLMTVNTAGDTKVECAWFIYFGTDQWQGPTYDSFAPDALDKVE